MEAHGVIRGVWSFSTLPALWVLWELAGLFCGWKPTLVGSREKNFNLVFSQNTCWLGQQLWSVNKNLGVPQSPVIWDIRPARASVSGNIDGWNFHAFLMNTHSKTFKNRLNNSWFRWAQYIYSPCFLLKACKELSLSENSHFLMTLISSALPAWVMGTPERAQLTRRSSPWDVGAKWLKWHSGSTEPGAQSGLYWMCQRALCFQRQQGPLAVFLPVIADRRAAPCSFL